MAPYIIVKLTKFSKFLKTPYIIVKKFAAFGGGVYNKFDTIIGTKGFYTGADDFGPPQAHFFQTSQYSNHFSIGKSTFYMRKD